MKGEHQRLAQAGMGEDGLKERVAGMWQAGRNAAPSLLGMLHAAHASAGPRTDLHE